MNALDNIDKKDRVCVVVDSIGNLASKKEVDDAMDGKSVASFCQVSKGSSLKNGLTVVGNYVMLPLIV